MGVAKEYVIEDSLEYEGLSIEDKARRVVAEMGETGQIAKVAWMMEIKKALYALAVECARARATKEYNPETNMKDRSLAERIRDAAVEHDKQGGFLTPGLAGFFVPKASEPLYCIVDPPSLRNPRTVFCFWSLGPTEEDAWRFFENGCADAGNGAIERARRDGLQCVRVRLSVEAVIAPGEKDNCQHERPRVECDKCDYLEDLAFDANRERRMR